jgi:hypothetical protein
MKTNAMIAYPISFSTNYFYSKIKYSVYPKVWTNDYSLSQNGLADQTFFWHPRESNLRAPLQPRVDHTTAGRRGFTPHLPHFLKSSPIFIIVCLFCRPSRMHKSRQNWSGYIHPDKICPDVHIWTVFKSGLWVI